jgi:hypothetical protein
MNSEATRSDPPTLGSYGEAGTLYMAMRSSGSNQTIEDKAWSSGSNQTIEDKACVV